MQPIRYAIGNTIVIELDEVYYIRSDLRYIFNDKLIKLNISNVDNWVQAKTHLKYSFQQIVDMARAFEDGLNSGYSWDDIIWTVNRTFRNTKSSILSSKYTQEYIKAYWIELTSQDDIRTKILDHFENNFDKLLNKLGDRKLSILLSRLINHCEYCAPDLQSAFIRMQNKLQIKVNEQPDTNDIDNEILSTIITSAIGKSTAKYKKIDNKITNNAITINKTVI